MALSFSSLTVSFLRRSALSHSHQRSRNWPEQRDGKATRSSSHHSGVQPPRATSRYKGRDGRKILQGWEEKEEELDLGIGLRSTSTAIAPRVVPYLDFQDPPGCSRRRRCTRSDSSVSPSSPTIGRPTDASRRAKARGCMYRPLPGRGQMPPATHKVVEHR